MTTVDRPIPVRRALLSVSDKTDIETLARALNDAGAEILSTGGTARLLTEAGIPATEVGDYTGFPEIMAGRVKTLHPRVHGGLLGRRGEDEAVMAEQDIPPIDLLVVNLYPFEAVTADPDCSLATAIEHIDIGGPAMLRAAAKNHAGVGVVTDPSQYSDVIDALGGDGLSAALRYELAVAAFNHVARYDAAISNYLSARSADGERADFPAQLNAHWQRIDTLRYGENPHQQAAFYQEAAAPAGSFASYRQCQGKALSYNNLADADAAWACAAAFEAPACVIVKHANPCGVAVADSLEQAYQAAFATDPTSAFGGIIAFNRPLDAATAEAIIARQFVEVILAPAVADEALAITGRKQNLRVLEIPHGPSTPGGWRLQPIGGGVLVQSQDAALYGDDASLRYVTEAAIDDSLRADLDFVWRVAKHVKSNAIVYGREGRTLGIGAGQMSRVDSARIGVRKATDAGLSLAGAVLASDAFFPFRDGVDQAAEAGVRAIVQPGGSMRDDEVIAAANEHGIAMAFTGMRHFRH